MSRKITVIGAGPGGYVAAIRAAQLGAEVTVIENHRVGGTCLNYGCIPSKMMITTARLLEKFNRAGEFGIETEGRAQVSMTQLIDRKNTLVQNQVRGILSLFKRHNITCLEGEGRIKGPGVAAVKQNRGGVQEVKWDKLILAIGTTPMDIPGIPFDGERILSSTHALSLRKVPASLLIVGGGAIGCEFAFIYAALGARVTVVEAMPRLLPLSSVDEESSKILQREMKKRKIQFLVNRVLESVTDTHGKTRAVIGPSPFLENPAEKDKTPLTVDADQILVCIGRKPNLADAGLETIGVKTDGKGWVVTDDRMETSVPGVYAVGDLLGPSKIMLAHAASEEGKIAAENAMGKNHKMDYSKVPGVIFTSPEVAGVGLTEAGAKAAGYNTRADKVLFRSLGKAHVLGEIAGQAKVVSDIQNGRILGVHIIGPDAGDLIAEASLAMTMGSTVQDLAATIHAHPTLSEIMQEAAFKAVDLPLHG